MNDVALRVENLSKVFVLGHHVAYHRFTEFIENVARNVAQLPSRWLAGKRGNRSPDQHQFWALDDVSFEVPRGEVCGVIGRNGAGKSTLLKLLSRITTPTHGRIEIRGRVGSLLEVGTGFHHELTGRENVFLNGAFLGMTRREIRQKFDAIVAFAEVEKFLDTPVKHYSSGMYIRLAFSIAAHLEPEILIVDEVLGVGDAAFQKKSMDVMREVARRGCTCLVVSHNLPTITNLCSRALLLQCGRLVANGPTAEVVQQYLASGLSLGGEIVWSDPATAPGHDAARLHAVRVRPTEATGPTSDIAISQEIEIEIEYWNLVDQACLSAGLTLRDHVATTVFTSSSVSPMSLTPDAWSGRPHPVGLFRSVCRIPAHFLNEGRYSITPFVAGGFAEIMAHVCEDVLSFNVHDTGEMRGEFFGHWPGIVRPWLPWSTEQVSSECEESKQVLASVQSRPHRTA